MKKIKALMETHVETVRPEASVIEAATKMKRSNIGALPVCQGDEVLGIITDRDIVTRVLAEGHDAKQLPVREIMSRDLVYAFDDQDLDEATDMMEKKRVGRLLVLSHDRQLKGILSLGNITRQELGEKHLAGVVGEQIEGSAFPSLFFGGLIAAAGAAFAYYLFQNRETAIPVIKDKIRQLRPSA